MVRDMEYTEEVDIVFLDGGKARLRALEAHFLHTNLQVEC